jgi:GxxExxY protein
MLRVKSPLDAQSEHLIEKIIGSCIAVHSALGPGFLESVYSRAVAIDFDFEGVPYERERRVQVLYRGRPVCTYQLDLVVADCIVIEIKCVDRLAPVHYAQLLGYLRASKLRAGLLVNFNVALLRDGVKRIVL